MRITTPLALFCEECGAANPLQVTECFACQQSLEQVEPAPRASTSIQPYYQGYRGISIPENDTTTLKHGNLATLTPPSEIADASSETLPPGSQLANRYVIVKVV